MSLIFRHIREQQVTRGRNRLSRMAQELRGRGVLTLRPASWNAEWRGGLNKRLGFGARFARHSLVLESRARWPLLVVSRLSRSVSAQPRPFTLHDPEARALLDFVNVRADVERRPDETMSTTHQVSTAPSRRIKSVTKSAASLNEQRSAALHPLARVGPTSMRKALEQHSHLTRQSKSRQAG